MKSLPLLKKFLLVMFGCLMLCCVMCSAPYIANSIAAKKFGYGKEFNPEREKRGIPVIPENWTPSVLSSGEIFWSDPDNYSFSGPGYGDGVEPVRYYSSKVIEIVDENTIKETDGYMGGEPLEIGKDGVESYQRVLITCVYYLDNIKDVTCTADVYTREMTFTNGDVEKAKTILEKWGLLYP